MTNLNKYKYQITFVTLFATLILTVALPMSNIGFQSTAATIEGSVDADGGDGGNGGDANGGDTDNSGDIKTGE